MSAHANFDQPNRTDGLCPTCPYMGRCGQPTSCPGPKFLIPGTSNIYQDHGQSILPGLMTQAAIEQERVAWIKRFTADNDVDSIQVHDDLLVRYNMNVERRFIEHAAFGFFPELDFYRADGRVKCEVCGDTYSRHPMYPLFPFVHIICNGDLVKL